MNWFTCALLAMVGLIPAFIAPGVLDKHYGVRPEVSAMLWQTMTGVGIGIWLVLGGRGSEITAFGGPHLSMVVLALVFGVMANVMLFQSLATSPNPGITVAIVNTNSILTFFIVAMLAMALPRFFEGGTFNGQQLLGVLLVVGGTVLFGLKQ